MKPVLIITIIAVCSIGLGLSINVSAEEGLVPSWIRTTAGFWVDGQIGDSEFIKSIEFLVKEDIIKISDGQDSSYMTYFSENDGYQIKIPSSWMSSEYDYDVNKINFHNTRPESEYGEIIIIAVSSDKHNELDDYIKLLKPHLERTVTDFEIIDENWSRYNDRIPYGYEIIYKERTGMYNVINSYHVVLENNLIYSIIHTTTENESSVDIDYIFDSFQAGTKIGYGEGYVFGQTLVQKPTSSTNSEFFDASCPSNYNLVKYSINKYGDESYHEADKNQDGYYCKVIISTGQQTYRDNS